MRKTLPHKLLSDLIRLPFGGGSDRPHHLRMAMLACVVAAISAFRICHDQLGLKPLPSAVMAFAAWAGSYAQEAWAGSDRDEEEKRRPANLYWLPYGKLVKHRAWASHGPIIGTAVRLAYGYLGLPYFMVAAMVFGDPVAQVVSLIGLAWIYGALVNDLGHLILDI